MIDPMQDTFALKDYSGGGDIAKLHPNILWKKCAGKNGKLQNKIKRRWLFLYDNMLRLYDNI